MSDSPSNPTPPATPGTAADDLVPDSRFLSLVLRHRPETIGLVLDREGWADVGELLRLAAAKGRRIGRDRLDRIVADNSKKRFALSPDGLRIRAVQGHSVEVDLGLPAVQPPAILFHGTADRFVESIRRTGLEKRSRRHVHLSADEATAVTVGRRHGKPVVLRVRAGDMAAAGYVFHRSENGVWLTESVPAVHIEFPTGA